MSLISTNPQIQSNLMQKKIEDYSFDDLYEDNWQKFKSSIYNDLEIKQLHFAKKWLLGLDELIRVLYQKEPGYSTQMEIYFHWKNLQYQLEKDPNNRILNQLLNWFCRQLINMIVCYNLEINKSVWYAIAVDYFECGTDGKWLFAPLYKQLPDYEIEELIQYSISIDWVAKKDCYWLVLANKNHHQFLAEAIMGSCSAYCFGAIKSSEALEILDQLVIDNEFDQRIKGRLLDPIPIKIDHILEIAIEKQQEYTHILAISSQRLSSFPTWFPFAELWVDGQNIGSIEHSYLGNNWEYIRKEYQLDVPANGSDRIIGIQQKQLNLQKKTGLLKPL